MESAAHLTDAMYVQAHTQGGHTLQTAPSRSFSPAQAMGVALGQMHSSCSVESLVSGAGGIPEGSHESSTTAMAACTMPAMPAQPCLQASSVKSCLQSFASAFSRSLEGCFKASLSVLSLYNVPDTVQACSRWAIIGT